MANGKKRSLKNKSTIDPPPPPSPLNAELSRVGCLNIFLPVKCQLSCSVSAQAICKSKYEGEHNSTYYPCLFFNDF